MEIGTIGQSEIDSSTRRADEAREKAASTSVGIVRETHERFAAAYAERLAQSRLARATVDEMLG